MEHESTMVELTKEQIGREMKEAGDLTVAWMTDGLGGPEYTLQWRVAAGMAKARQEQKEKDIIPVSKILDAGLCDSSDYDRGCQDTAEKIEKAILENK